MSVESEAVDDGTQLVVVAAVAERSSASRLRDALRAPIDQGKRRIVVDLSSLDSLDSPTLAVLVNNLMRAEEAGASLALVYTAKDIAAMLEMTGFDEFFPVYRSREEALAGRRA